MFSHVWLYKICSYVNNNNKNTVPREPGFEDCLDKKGGCWRIIEQRRSQRGLEGFLENPKHVIYGKEKKRH